MRFPDISPAPFLCGTDPSASNMAFLAGAQGNLDNDSVLDQWTISSDSRTIGAGCDATGNVPGGEPANDQNDLNR
jgi:hypothetical protein